MHSYERQSALINLLSARTIFQLSSTLCYTLSFVNIQIVRMLMVETKQMYDNNGTLSPTKTSRPVTGGFIIAFY